MSEILLLTLRGLLLALSFAGLCAAVRHFLKLDRFCAPFVAASGIIVLLMAAGMLGALYAGFLLVFAGGLAGLVYTCFIRRIRPDFTVIGLIAVYTLYLIWRFGGCTLNQHDDFSHWAIVARHLMQHDAFPDGGAELLISQSYPLGSAVFLYYFCRFTGTSDGMWLVAQNLLTGLAFLPLLSHIRGHRPLLYAMAAVLFVYLTKFTRSVIGLQVDVLMGFWGIGMTAAALGCKGRFRSLMAAVLPTAAAGVFLKNSGLFFAPWGVLLAYAAADRRRGRADALRAGLLCLGAVCLAYGAWSLHLKLRFPSAETSAHAVSLSSYSRIALSKDPALISSTAAAMLRAVFRPSASQLLTFFSVAGSALLGWALTRRKPGGRSARKPLYAGLALSAAVYAAWMVMLFLTYIFSMSADEAARLASFDRYNATAQIWTIGLSAVFLFRFLSEAEFRVPRGPCIGAAAVLAAASVLAFTLTPLGVSFLGAVLPGDAPADGLRPALARAREESGLPESARWLVFMPEEIPGYSSGTLYYLMRYELYTPDPVGLIRIAGEDAAYGWSDNAAFHPIGDLDAYLSGVRDDFDAVLLLGGDPVFEAALARCETGAIVCPAYLPSGAD